MRARPAPAPRPMPAAAAPAPPAPPGAQSGAADALAIVPHPHPALRTKSRPVREIDAALRRAVQEMFELMYAHEGVGLAANQVARPWRLFVANPTGEADRKDQEFVFVNPEIVARTGSGTGEEGCLSLPEVFGDVRRADRVTVEAFDLRGNLFSLDLRDLPARVIQHEFDHVDGVMFPDRMTASERLKISAEVADFEHAWKKRQRSGELPSDRQLLAEFERYRV